MVFYLIDLKGVKTYLEKWKYFVSIHSEQIWIDLGRDYTIRYSIDDFTLSYEVTDNRNNHNLWIFDNEHSILNRSILEIAKLIESLTWEIGFYLYEDLNYLLREQIIFS